MSKFTDVLVVSPLADGKTWVTRNEFGYDVGEKGSGDSVDVEIGFQTDFASVPRPLWWLFPRWSKYGNAAVVHDWLYWEQKRTKAQADNIFKEAMTVLQVPGWKKWLMYLAVKFGGWPSWRGNRKKRRQGLSRVQPLPTKANEEKSFAPTPTSTT